MERMVRIALIGAGRIGAVHAEAFGKVKGSKIVIVVDQDEKRARLLQEQHGNMEYASDYKSVLSRNDIDAVDVCAPTYLHEEIVITAALAGKHILCEKPLALTVDAVEHMTNAATQAGVILMVAFCRRYDNHWLRVKELVSSGLIGHPVIWRYVQAICGGTGVKSWFAQKEQGGGLIIDTAIHNFDFARLMFGESTKIMANTLRFRTDATAVDTGNALVSFASGSSLLLSISWGLPEGAEGVYINDIIGPQGIIYFDGAGPSRLQRSVSNVPFNQGSIVADLGTRGGICRYTYDKNNMYSGEIQAFTDSIRAGTPSPIDGRECAYSLAIAHAALESGEKGYAVTPAFNA